MGTNMKIEKVCWLSKTNIIIDVNMNLKINYQYLKTKFMQWHMDVSDMSTVLTDPTEGREWGRSVRRPDRDSVDDPLAALSDLQNTDQV